MEEKNKKNLELAVIFKSSQSENGLTLFIPQKIILGSLDIDGISFLDTKGKKYNHMVIKNNDKYCFGLRTGIKELNSIYKVSSLKELLTTYTKHIKEYTYYFAFPESSKKEFSDLILVSEDNEYHNQMTLFDKDLENLKVTAKLEEEQELKQTKINTFNTNDLITGVKSKIIGQDEQIEDIVSIIWQNCHSSRKSNIMIVGPTGTGKTEIIRLIAKKLNIPVIVANAASLTQSGYVGESVDDILKNLINKCNGNVKKAEQAIVILDEMDKIASNGISHDGVATSGVQDELLKLTEDGSYFVNMGDMFEEDKVEISTKNMTFIGIGAFSNLRKEIVEKVISGFSTQPKQEPIKTIKKATTDDLIQYGLKPELVGRFSNVIELNPLTEENLIQIMKNPNNDTLSEKRKILQERNITVQIEESVYEKLAKIAIEKKIGARGLISSIDNLFTKAMLEISRSDDIYSKLIITEKTIENPKNYTLIRKK